MHVLMKSLQILALSYILPRHDLAKADCTLWLLKDNGRAGGELSKSGSLLLSRSVRCLIGTDDPQDEIGALEFKRDELIDRKDLQPKQPVKSCC